MPPQETMGETAANLQNKRPFRICQLGREGGFERVEITPFIPHLHSLRRGHKCSLLSISPSIFAAFKRKVFVLAKVKGLMLFS